MIVVMWVVLTQPTSLLMIATGGLEHSKMRVVRHPWELLDSQRPGVRVITFVFSHPPPTLPSSPSKLAIIIYGNLEIFIDLLLYVIVYFVLAPL